MEGGVETGDLGQFWKFLRKDAYRRQIVWLVQRRQRYQAVEFVKQCWVTRIGLPRLSPPCTIRWPTATISSPISVPLTQSSTY